MFFVFVFKRRDRVIRGSSVFVPCIPYMGGKRRKSNCDKIRNIESGDVKGSLTLRKGHSFDGIGRDDADKFVWEHSTVGW